MAHDARILQGESGESNTAAMAAAANGANGGAACEGVIVPLPVAADGVIVGVVLSFKAAADLPLLVLLAETAETSSSSPELHSQSASCLDRWVNKHATSKASELSVGRENLIPEIER